MGQGYSLTTLSAGSARIDVPELSDLAYEKSLGDARFMKAVRARHREGLVVVKVVMKPYSSMQFDKYIKETLRERKILNDVPNTMGYHRAFETSSNGYLLRQYIYNSIYDRMSTRPFLEDIEKRWLAYQLLCAVRECHARSLYHGDIKTENTLVTSWNWLYLADFSSSFKPTYLPEDNPAEFSFYFDIAGRRTCYLAPERFLRPGEKLEGRQGVTWAMDIFSAGCVIAELFLEAPIFNLSQLFNYRKGEFDPEKTVLQRIEDSDVREMIAHMIQIEPESRFSADEYLNFWRNKAFPEYFYNFLHPFMHLITDPSSGRSQITAGHTNFGESDDRIERIYADFDKISYFLNYKELTSEATIESQDLAEPSSDLFPLYVDIPKRRRLESARNEAPIEDDGTLLFLSVVTSAIRSTARASSRIKACELLLAFAEHVTDDSKLDRILPYVMTLLHDASEMVKVAALRALTQLVSMVSTTSPVNANIFPEYILPRLEPFTLASGKRPSPLVRATYASCLAVLAESASRFLDLVQVLRAEGFMPSIDPETENDAVAQFSYQSYDTARASLVKYFETQTKSLLTDNNPDVRKAFLGSVSNLCVFFGSVKANDVILSHLNTYLNDRDWRLKCAFFEAIVGVAIYVGESSLEEFILPLMVPALTDPEEAVVEKVIRSLSSMAELGLFQRSILWRLIELVAKFTMHPNLWIREAAASFLTNSTKYLSVADCLCLVRPILEPYMRVFPATFDEIAILECLKEPLSRPVVDMAITWARKTDKGVFWKPVQQRSSMNLMDDRVPLTPNPDLSPNALSRYTKNGEDHQWINRLKSAGMSHEDEFKVLTLKGYFWRMASQKGGKDDRSGSGLEVLNEIVSLKDLGVSLKTVFFNHNQDLLSKGDEEEFNPEKPQTIADALLDASTNIDDAAEARGRFMSTDAEPNQRVRALRTESTPSSPRMPSPDLQSESGESGVYRQNSARPGARKLHPEHELHQKASFSTLSTQRTDKATLPKDSAINLMRRGSNTGKANAQTHTSSETAQGKIDTPSSRDQSVKPPMVRIREEQARKPQRLRYQAAHSYNGRDPHILKFLDSVYLDNHPVDLVEFGPLVPRVETRQWEKKPTSATWRPAGTLIAMLSEHTGAVRRVLASSDHLFFITGSDDGSVKVWDTGRLERNLAHRSRQTHKHNTNVKVTGLCFIEDTHCFASTGNDGSVHVVNVECVEASLGVTKYGKLKLLRDWKIPNGAHSVWIEHIKTDTHSILLIATDDCKVLGVDLRTMDVLYVLRNPVEHGTPTCFCVDLHRHWLLLGTYTGHLDLWDLRFGLRLKAWSFSGKAPINRLTLHPRQKLDTESMQRSHSDKPTYLKRAIVAGGTGDNSITVWNLEKGTCLAVYRTGPSSSPSLASPLDPSPAQFKTNRESGNADIYSLKDISSQILGSSLFNDTGTELMNAMNFDAPADSGTRAFIPGLLPRSEAGNSRRMRPFLIAAGPDRKVRLWNLDKVANSCVVSGLEAEEAQPSYIAVEGAELRTNAEVWEEQWPQRSDDPSAKSAGVSGSGADGGGGGGGSARTSKNSDAKRTARPGGPRNTVISVQQQQLLKTHMDMVTDVAILEYPMRMVVSVDRSGVVMVFS